MVRRTPFTVSAVNSAGTGPASAPSNSVTPSASTITVPAATVTAAQFVQLTATVTNPSSNARHVTWDFGDGTVSQPDVVTTTVTAGPGTTLTTTASHLYAAAGSYTVTAYVTENPTVTTTTTATVNYAATSISFTATPTLGTTFIVGVPVTFTATVSAVSPGEPPSINGSVTWDFGDGTASQPDTVDTPLTAGTATTPHTYAAAGSYTVTVNFPGTDEFTASMSATMTLKVQSPAQAIAPAIALVQQLPLNKGQKMSLTSKLNAVTAYLNQGDIPDACSTLGAEVSEINALVRGNRISAASAASLLGAIQSSLGCL
jgi:hypothetical protein